MGDSEKPEKVPHLKKGPPSCIDSFFRIAYFVFMGNWRTGELEKILRLGAGAGGGMAIRRRLGIGYSLYYYFYL